MFAGVHALATLLAALVVSPLAGGRATHVCGGGGIPYPQAAVAAGWVLCRNAATAVAPGGRTIRLRGLAPWSLAVARGRLWVIDRDRPALVAVDARSGAVRRRIALPDTPDVVAAGNGAVWVGFGSAGAARIDPASGAVTPVGAGDGVSGFAFHAGTTWIVSHRDNLLTRVDADGSVHRSTAPLAPTTTAAAEHVAWANGSLWITGRGLDLLRVEPDTGRVAGTTEIGPAGIDVVAAGGRLLVPVYTPAGARRGDPLLASIVSVDPADGRVAARLACTRRFLYAGMSFARGALRIADVVGGVLVDLPPARVPTAAHASYSFRKIADGLSEAVYVTSAPGDPATLYVVQQRGTVQIVRDGAVAGTYLDIRDRVLDDGERGLLSIAFDPAYATNRYAYVDYVDKSNVTHVARFTDGDATTGQDLLTIQQPYPNHKGGQLAFDRAGRLYVGMGDGGTNYERDGDRAIGDPENRAQTPSSRLGKLLRTKPGSGTWQTIGYGLRNPWRFSFDSATGNLWIGDVGAGKLEEIDFRPAAKLNAVANYGWSHWEGDLIYNVTVRLAKGIPYVAPTWAYPHSTRCSVIGGYVYRGSAVPAARGRYFFGDFCDGSISSFKAGPKGKAGPPAQLPGSIPNLSSFGLDGRGELYAVSLDGGLYRLAP
jgi:glucose/arabinose dehydrogenase